MLLRTLLLACLLCVPAQAAEPDPTSRSLPAAAVESLRDLIQRGADLYNAGDHAACYRLYQGALLATRPWLERQPDRQRDIDRTLAEAEREPVMGERAFVLRRALDRFLEPPAKTVPAPAGKPGFALSAEEQAVLDLSNRERERAGLPPLRADEKLCQAAREHSTNMARQDRLDHVLDGKDPGQRLRDVGYRSFGWGENCAAGQRTAAEAVSTWMNSPGHRANILNGSFTEIGIGIAPNGRGGHYYTQVFATPAPR